MLDFQLLNTIFKIPNIAKYTLKFFNKCIPKFLNFPKPQNIFLKIVPTALISGVNIVGLFKNSITLVIYVPIENLLAIVFPIYLGNAKNNPIKPPLSFHLPARKLPKIPLAFLALLSSTPHNLEAPLKAPNEPSPFLKSPLPNKNLLNEVLIILLYWL